MPSVSATAMTPCSAALTASIDGGGCIEGAPKPAVVAPLAPRCPQKPPAASLPQAASTDLSVGAAVVPKHFLPSWFGECVNR
jgi:hypothetical protein